MTTPQCYEPDLILKKYLTPDSVEKYFDLLMSENRSTNLVSRETTREDFNRLVCESLLPLEKISLGIGSYLDIGSGSGIPAIPILLARPEIKRACLIERTQKKAAALTRIAEVLAPKARVLPSPFEETSFDETFDLITLRYVKLSRRLLTKILKYLTPEGVFVYYSAPEFPVAAPSAKVCPFTISQQNARKNFTLFRKNSAH